MYDSDEKRERYSFKMVHFIGTHLHKIKYYIIAFAILHETPPALLPRNNYIAPANIL